MSGGGATGLGWSRRVGARARTLRTLLRDTQRALHDVTDILQFDPEISIAVQEISNQSSRCATLVILGTSGSAKARLLHSLLGRKLLPDPPPRSCRWLRIQYGSSTAVHLTLGNSEFELVEDLECNKKPWTTLPVEDLIRQDQTDQATMLEVELNNSFLKDGLKIIVPPDIPSDGATNYEALKRVHSDLYTKRELILKNFNPIYLYAIDKIGKNIFNECIVCDKIVSSRSEEDFWNTFNMYYSGRSEQEIEKTDVRVRWKEAGYSGEPAVLTAENCLDLHQVKEINPNSQVHFVLFSNSGDVTEQKRREWKLHISVEATESTEDAVFSSEELPESDQELLKDGVLRPTAESPEQTKSDKRRLYEEQIAFMNELLDQWELMSNPTPKHYVKSQWSIIDDTEILRTIDHKALAPIISAAIENAEETSGKGCKREGDRVIRGRSGLLNQIVKFATDCMQSYLLEYCTRLSEIHIKLLQQFILASFDMARELQVLPKKIQYVSKQEQQLYETINEKFSEGDKKQELVQIMQEVLQEMKVEVNNMDWSVDDLPCHQDRRFVISNSVFYSSRSSPEHISLHLRPPNNQNAPNHRTELSTNHSTPFDSRTNHFTNHSASIGVRFDQSTNQELPSDGEEAASYDSCNFDDYEIINDHEESFSASDFYNRVRPLADDTQSITSQPSTIRVENEMGMFSLSRGVFSLRSDVTTCSGSNMSAKHASLDVQHTVLSKLSRKISLKLVKFVDCLKDTYFGTLQRCLESLESTCRQELGGRPASEAMRQLLSVARQVDLQPCASFSLVRSLLDSIRRLFNKLRIVSGEDDNACCVLSAAWRRSIAVQTTHSLTPTRLARIISTQILERLSTAHERYQSALTALESALANRLHHTEDVKLAIRKKYAPAFARLCLESTSMCDLLMYGTPELGREIGRGQYGVVYAVRGPWAGHSPCAVKSVLPADERHYHELAMEFFYTRSIPAHPRIVRLHGSIVQRHGSGPSVLLVSQRFARDLHQAVRGPLSFYIRMRISLDIVEGIRYLHSLGLVHRDIKMKNVLLDNEDRAALSDLGFCAAEALISGSVVGTPVHMAPELLAGEYDAAVDVYAFGILFWYLCAGNIKLPSAFEVFQNKEQLWSKVKRGLRPERLPHFTDACWEVMESCWHSEPSQRALLGDIQPKLQMILEQAFLEEQTSPQTSPVQAVQDYRECDSDDSLDMTGIERNEIF